MAMSFPYNDRRLKNGRRPLGTFSEKIFLEKLARGERAFGQPLTMDPIIDLCGVYERNTIVKEAKILFCTSYSRFYFHKSILSEEQRLMMNATPKIRIRNNFLMYASNPHHSNINQMKLYFDEDQVQRCLLKDLFCRPLNGVLRLKTDILLIDKGSIVHDVDYSCIYDFPQAISHYQEIEPEAKQARLSLGDSVPDDFTDKELNDFFLKLMIGWDSLTTYNVKILDFKNDTYYVDLICEHKSIMSMVLEQFKDTKLKRFLKKRAPPNRIGYDTVDHAELLPVRHMLPSRLSKKTPVNPNQGRNTSLPPAKGHPRRFQKYVGALGYFKDQLYVASTTDSKSYIDKRFPRVVITDWHTPGHLAIQPAGTDYIESHEHFVKMLHELPCVKDAESSNYKSDRPYCVGEHVLFRNVFGEPEFGTWLRGVVVSVTCYNQHSISLGSFNNKVDSHETLLKLVEEGKLDPADLRYLIRSVDYGHQRPSSHINMRHLRDLREIKRIGTWTIRCRLFGVMPLLNESRYSGCCADLMDSWMRERLLDNGRLAHFHILFRSDISEAKYFDSYDRQFDVSLFHRYEPPYTIDEAYLLGPRKTRFDCLNWHLVDRGVAEDYCGYDHSVTANIQLEEYIVNILVPHHMI